MDHHGLLCTGEHQRLDGVDQHASVRGTSRLCVPCCSQGSRRSAWCKYVNITPTLIIFIYIYLIYIFMLFFAILFLLLLFIFD